ncbi:MAG: hypothetical protein ACLQU3_10885 [Limisphaerales bacterium]
MNSNDQSIDQMALTGFRKTIIVAALAVAVAAGAYVVHRNFCLRDQNQILRQQQALLTEQIRRLQREHDEMTNRLGSLRAENTQLKSRQSAGEVLRLRGEVARLQSGLQDYARSKTTNEASKATMERWAAQANHLKQLMAQRPNLAIPEFELLTDDDWLLYAHLTSRSRLETEDGIREVAATLRMKAKAHLLDIVKNALNQYVAANNGQLPSDLSQLSPYFGSSVDPAMLQRYQVLQTGNLVDYPEAEPLVGEKAPVDADYDYLFQIGAHGFVGRGVGKLSGSEVGTLSPTSNRNR